MISEHKVLIDSNNWLKKNSYETNIEKAFELIYKYYKSVSKIAYDNEICKKLYFGILNDEIIFPVLEWEISIDDENNIEITDICSNSKLLYCTFNLYKKSKNKETNKISNISINLNIVRKEDGFDTKKYFIKDVFNYNISKFVEVKSHNIFTDLANNYEDIISKLGIEKTSLIEKTKVLFLENDDKISVLSKFDYDNKAIEENLKLYISQILSDNILINNLREIVIKTNESDNVICCMLDIYIYSIIQNILPNELLKYILEMDKEFYSILELGSKDLINKNIRDDIDRYYENSEYRFYNSALKRKFIEAFNERVIDKRIKDLANYVLVDISKIEKKYDLDFLDFSDAQYEEYLNTYIKNKSLDRVQIWNKITSKYLEFSKQQIYNEERNDSIGLENLINKNNNDNMIIHSLNDFIVILESSYNTSKTIYEKQTIVYKLFALGGYTIKDLYESETKITKYNYKMVLEHLFSFTYNSRNYKFDNLINFGVKICEKLIADSNNSPRNIIMDTSSAWLFSLRKSKKGEHSKTRMSEADTSRITKRLVSRFNATSILDYEISNKMLMKSNLELLLFCSKLDCLPINYNAFKNLNKAIDYLASSSENLLPKMVNKYIQKKLSFYLAMSQES